MPPIEAILEENERLLGQVSTMEQQMAAMQARIEWLTRQVFGAGKSEKFDRSQLLLELEELTVAVAATEAPTETISYERQKPRHKGREVPAEHFADVPVKEAVEIIPEEVKADPQLYEKIGQEETFEIDVTPPKLFKRLFIRPKYRHRIDRARPPVIAPAMKRPLEGSYASAGLLAWIMLSKYVDHLPLYRQEKMSVRWGASISRKSMARWVEVVAEWLKPIYNRMREQLLQGDYLQADETPVRYHDPDIKKGKTEQGWLWAMSRPGGDVIFQWRLSRRHGEVVKLLGDYKGVLQSDGYEAYRAYAASRPDVIWVGCWAHARRRFREALQESPVAAGFILQLIGNLYHMERTWDEKALTGARVRVARRQSDFPMTLGLLKKTLLVLRRRALPRSGLGKACQYMLNHWEQPGRSRESVPRTVANAAILIVTRLVTIRYPNGDHRLPATSPAGTQNVTFCHHVNKDAVQTLTSK